MPKTLQEHCSFPNNGTQRVLMDPINLISMEVIIKCSSKVSKLEKDIFSKKKKKKGKRY